MPTKNITAKFEIDDRMQIRCCHAMDNYLYVGAGHSAIVYRTQDGFGISEFYKIEDSYVTAITDYENSLFVGTSPGGGIYMHNFSTGNRFHYVISGDYQVTSFCMFNGKLYAGTSPSGLVLSFDGTKWVMEYDSYGGGIKNMSVIGDKMCIFVDGTDFIPYLSSSGWSFLKSGDNNFSLSSSKKVSTTIDIIKKNLNFDFSFNSSCVCNEKLYFCPSNKCNLYCYDGTKVSIVYQWSGSSIRAIENVGDSQLFVVVDDTVYASSV